MKSKITRKALKYFYFFLLLGYTLFLLSSLLISLLESFSYSGFFLKHFGVSLEFFIYALFGFGLLIFLIPFDINISQKWVKLIKKFLLVNVYVLTAFLLTALTINVLERINYNNFIYSKIHLQPKLLIKTVILQIFSLCVNFWLVVRAGGYGRFFKIRLLRGTKVSASTIKDSILIIYSAVLFVFILTGSLRFVYKFYTEENTFLRENELNYALKEMDIYQWIAEFFPKTKDIVNWCDQQSKPVELVTFDPEMIWMNYEGLSRVFLTNCYFANIYSWNKSYSYIGKDNMLLVSITPCDRKLEEKKGDPNGNIMEYLKVVNNQYICQSSEVIPGLYLYKGKGGKK